MGSARRLLVATLVLLPCAALPACGAPPLVLPQPPQDLTALAQAYATPTGTIDVANLEQTVNDAKTRFYDSDLDWLPPLVSAALVRMHHRFDDNGFPLDPLVTREENRPSLQAVINAQHTCNGWVEPVGPPNAAQNGDFVVTAVIDDTQLRRELWGTATQCQERIEAMNLIGVNAFLTASFGILLQGPLPANAQETRALVQVSGDVGTQNHVASNSFDFQIVGPTVEFRYPVTDGDVIVSIGLQTISVRGSNGSYTCDLVGRNCAASP